MIMQMLKILSLLVVFGSVGSGFAVSVYLQTAHAQTQGMERRDERRGTRQTSRDVKQACKAGGDSRSECRQTKRDVKQEGRRHDAPATNSVTH